MGRPIGMGVDPNMPMEIVKDSAKRLLDDADSMDRVLEGYNPIDREGAEVKLRALAQVSGLDELEALDSATVGAMPSIADLRNQEREFLSDYFAKQITKFQAYLALSEDERKERLSEIVRDALLTKWKRTLGGGSGVWSEEMKYLKSRADAQKLANKILEEVLGQEKRYEIEDKFTNLETKGIAITSRVIDETLDEYMT